MELLRAVETVNKFHQNADKLIHAENHQCYNNGSNKHDDCTLEQLRPGWPGGLIPEFGVALLKIRK